MGKIFLLQRSNLFTKMGRNIFLLVDKRVWLNCKLNVINAENVDLRTKRRERPVGQKCVNFDLEKLTSFST